MCQGGCRGTSAAAWASSRRSGASRPRGVVPACRSLDCPSVFARCVEDGAEVARLMQARISCLHNFRLTLCESLTPAGTMIVIADMSAGRA